MEKLAKAAVLVVGFLMASGAAGGESQPAAAQAGQAGPIANRPEPKLSGGAAQASSDGGAPEDSRGVGARPSQELAKRLSDDGLRACDLDRHAAPALLGREQPKEPNLDFGPGHFLTETLGELDVGFEGGGGEVRKFVTKGFCVTLGFAKGHNRSKRIDAAAAAAEEAGLKDYNVGLGFGFKF